MNRRLLVVMLLLAAAIAAAPQQEERGGSGDEGSFIVISITPFSNVTFDVKLKNPRTGYVHSVTVTIDIARLLHIGDLVRQRSSRGRVVLVPVQPREEPRPEPQPQPQPAPFHFPFELPAGAAEVVLPPCAQNLACAPPAEPAEPQNPAPLDLAKVKTATPVLRVESMSFAYDPNHPGARPLPTDCDLLTSGSFTDGTRAVGPLKIDGSVFVSGYSDKRGLPFEGTDIKGVTTRYRGAIAIVDDTPRIVRQTGDPQRDYAGAASFMGGAALLVHDGAAISDDDLCCCQGFVDSVPGKKTLNASTCGFKAGQFRSTHHVIAASKGDQFYVFEMQGGRRNIQERLVAAGFDEAIKLDGGSGAFMYTRSGKVFDGGGRNSTRLCVYGMFINTKKPSP
jgi:hypothetical protein